MKEKKEFEWQKSGCIVTLGFFSFLFLILYFIKQAEDKKKLLDEKGVYSIAEIVDVTIDDGTANIVIEYKFNNKTILRSIHENCCPEIGKLYYIKILPDNPRGIMILFSGTEVPDYIQTNISQEGWKEPPSYIKNAHLYEVSD
ncbi:hypothetical protein AD998_02485 [bacterium 336/3]|nr:hypothetical protein AD998_02485 [bacterium 336/3]